MLGTERKFTEAEFLSAIWAIFAVCILFIAIRVAIRIAIFKKLLIDDYWALLAFVFLLINSVPLTVAKVPTFVVQGVQFDRLQKPGDFKHETTRFDDLQWAISNIFFSGLWSVKGSFLAFYKELTEGLTAHRLAWWFIVVVTVLTYIGSIVGFALWNRVLVEVGSRADLKSENIQYQFGADLATDVFITILPLTLALKANVNVRRKLTLAGVFSLGLIITVFAIVRFAVNAPHSSPYGPSWIFVWSQVEQGVSVIVVCLASFRTFIVSRRREAESCRRQPSSGYQGGGVKAKGLFFGVNAKDSSTAANARSRGTLRRSEDSMEVELLDMIQVENATGAPSAKTRKHTVS